MKDSGYDHNRDDLAIGYANALAEAEFIDMSIPYAGGALYSTVEDLYTWDQALYTEQLVSQALLDSMFSPSALVSAADGWSYGYGWFIGQAGNRQVITHGGGIEGYATQMTRFPDDRVTIIVLSNQENVDAAYISELLAEKVFEKDEG